MSKASEFAKAKQAVMEFNNKDNLDRFIYVNNDGNLGVDGQTLLPKEALALAAWIQDVFGENNVSPRIP